jgi:formate-dependent nitrite reductase membrane component NrfD
MDIGLDNRSWWLKLLRNGGWLHYVCKRILLLNFFIDKVLDIFLRRRLFKVSKIVIVCFFEISKIFLLRFWYELNFFGF